MSGLYFEDIEITYKQPPPIAMIKGYWFELSCEGRVFRYLAHKGTFWIVGVDL
ncbi:hypothetical protein [Vibrio phage vB_VpM-pA2SJ1]|uniref:Uncharacterized protein n=1 Tax=Vibrio phage vB_VpM-pA2SJ1 TaxID=3095964 RepID=A0AAX4J5I9_9CAUD